MSDGHTTLEDVARKAGVSIATASRALTGKSVAKANREKVEAAASALGYVANQAARSLRNVRTMTVGVVFDQLNSPLATELLDALAMGLEAGGYSLFVSTAQGREERYDALVHHYLERRVDALMCVRGSGQGGDLPRYAAAGIPVLALFYASGGYGELPLVRPAISEAVEACLTRLNSYGHRRIAFLRPTRRSPPIEGFIAQARAAGMDVRNFEISEESFDAVACLEALLRDSLPPTVVVARQADAVALFKAADEMSVLVPQALSLVGIRDRTLGMPSTRLPLSMIHLNPSMVGKVAAAMVLETLSGGAAITTDSWVQMGSWIERGTTAPAPKGALQPSAFQPT